MEEQTLLLGILFATLLLAVFFLCLYRSERQRRKNAEKLVRGGELFQQAYGSNQKECYLYLDAADLRVRHSSENLEAMTGLTPERLAVDVEVASGLVSIPEKRRIYRTLSEWKQEESLSIETAYHRWEESEERHARLRIERTGEGYLVILQDDTEEYAQRIQIEEELQKVRSESRQKTDFLSKMSHEIRTPMNGIIGMLELTRIHLDDKQAAEGYLERMSELSQFLLTLINDILDMSRIESGKMVLEQVPFNLFAMAEKLDTMFRGTIEAKGVEWDIRMQDFDVCYVVGDEMRLSQVLINFISNASKFTPAGGKIEVLFRQMDLIQNELHLMIRVRDTGKGIREDFISKIFRPFEQEDASTAHNYGGSGLGMAIADNILRFAGIQADFLQPEAVRKEAEEKKLGLEECNFNRVLDLVRKARFGGKEMTPHERLALDGYSEMVEEILKKHTKLPGRLVLRYVYLVK